MRARDWTRLPTLLLTLTATFLSSAVSAAEEINLYTTREAALVKPVTDAFTKATGITVNATFIEDNLSKRVASEGKTSPADVLLTIGLDKTSQFATLGLTRPIKSTALDKAIPFELRDRGRAWFGMAMRPRVVVARSDSALASITYEDLAKPEWRGKLCMRTVLHQNNVALVAAYLLHNGVPATEAWLKGLKTNLAGLPEGKDNDVIRRIAQGRCEIGIANTVALAQLRDGREGADWKTDADKVKAVPTTFRNRGTHMNVTAVGIAKHAPHKAAALKFVEFLVTDEAQKLFAEAELEYPVTKTGARAPIVTDIGSFPIDDRPIDQIATTQKAAVDLIRKAGFTK
ncbi:extracellular solute-binding protein [Tardiphaga sp.]|jgi:iron(III) transport system substrate-binding protein|uniref:extracellular solute-binding protein n=1 Tax=Tardiphaga sp. TaxID=1926292 RepID=UPI0037DA70D0